MSIENENDNVLYSASSRIIWNKVNALRISPQSMVSNLDGYTFE